MKFAYFLTLYVGLDIGSHRNFIAALNYDLEPLINMRLVPNVTSGIETMESTNFYSVYVANYLSISDLLKPNSCFHNILLELATYENITLFLRPVPHVYHVV